MSWQIRGTDKYDVPTFISTRQYIEGYQFVIEENITCKNNYVYTSF